jgi:hypothetical protein
MGLIDLVLTVCLIGHPSNCHDEHLYLEHAGVVQCALQGPPEIAIWTSRHPKYRVSRWKCVVPQRGRHI